jgi:hypothetical protein
MFNKYLPVSKKGLGINVTSVLVIQVEVFVVCVGLKTILHTTLNFIENQRIYS